MENKLTNNDMPRCHYCGKFLDAKKTDVIAETIYGHLDIECILFYHIKCKDTTKQ